MSELVEEATEPETPEIEEPEPETEPQPEPEEPEASADDEDAAEEPEPVEAQPARSEAWWEKAWKASEKENEKHAARVSAIFEEESQEFNQCPMCLTGPAGWLVSPHFSDEHAALIRGALGDASPSDFEPMPGAVMCETCQGKGKVSTPSRVPGHNVLMCPTCSETGWRHVTGPSGGAYTPLAAPEPTENGVPIPVEPLPFDAWSRPYGHPHYNIPPADVGV